MKAKGAGEWPPRNANGGIAVWGSGKNGSTAQMLIK